MGGNGWGPDPSVGIATVENIIGSEIVGREVWEIEDIVDPFDYPYIDIGPFIGGVEMALWDAFGKQKDTPIHQFLGGKRTDDLPVAYCVGILDPEESAAEARWTIEQEFEVIKTQGGLNRWLGGRLSLQKS